MNGGTRGARGRKARAARAQPAPAHAQEREEGAANADREKRIAPLRARIKERATEDAAVSMLALNLFLGAR